MKRTTFRLLGIVCVGLGILGALLPLLPTTIFFILAAGLFARSSPELKSRLLAHPVFGPQVIAWRKYGAISPKAKMLAIGGMTFGFFVFYLTAHPALWLALLVAVALALCALFVGTRPAGPVTTD